MKNKLKISSKKVDVFYGENQALNKINLDIIENKVTSLIGPSGCGKSTFMKAIGLNIILAQAGFYVSASEFEYYPYTQIFTRILNNDNIFQGQSSFAVEMIELRTRYCELACMKTLIL